MTVLAIDTASRRRAFCVLAGGDGRLQAEERLDGRRLDAALPPALVSLLGVATPTAVAVVLGPGSYTGLRVGIASALGLAHARDLPLHGLDALEVVARAAPSGAVDVEAVADAGRGALYVARYRRDGAELRCSEAAHRVEQQDWQAAPGHVAVSLDAVPGALQCEERAAAALADAAIAALRRPALPRTGLEPVYLGGDRSAAARPRV